MADFLDPVRLEDEQFGRLLELVEGAISRREGTLLSDNRLQLPWIEIFDPEVLDSDEWGELGSAVDYLDTLVNLAFEGAPDSMIERWAEDRDTSLKERALHRVRRIRDEMPHLRSLWEARRSSLVPTLNLPEFQIVQVASAAEAQVDFLLTVATRSFGNRPDPGSSRHVLVRLLPNDVAYLRNFLDNILEEMTDQSTEDKSDSEGEAHESRG